VFYHGQCQSRNTKLLDLVLSVQGRISDVLLQAGAVYERDEALKIVKLMNVVQILMYTGIDSGVYTNNNLFEPLVDSYDLLTPQEKQKAQSGGWSIVMHWLNKKIHTDTKNGKMEPLTANIFKDQFHRMRATVATLGDALDFPISFTYSQYTFAAVSFFLMDLSLAFGFNVDMEVEHTASREIFTALVVVLNNIFFLGLYLVSVALVFPFGVEAMDFCGVNNCQSSLKSSMAKINDAFNDELGNDPSEGDKNMIVDDQTQPLVQLK